MSSGLVRRVEGGGGGMTGSGLNLQRYPLAALEDASAVGLIGKIGSWADAEVQTRSAGDEAWGDRTRTGEEQAQMT